MATVSRSKSARSKAASKAAGRKAVAAKAVVAKAAPPASDVHQGGPSDVWGPIVAPRPPRRLQPHQAAYAIVILRPHGVWKPFDEKDVPPEGAFTIDADEACQRDATELAIGLNLEFKKRKHVNHWAVVVPIERLAVDHPAVVVDDNFDFIVDGSEGGGE